MRRWLLLLCLSFALPGLGGELAVIGAPPELTASLQAIGGVQLRVVKGRAKTAKDALRAMGGAEHVLWVKPQGKRADAALFARSGKPLGLVRATLKKGKWGQASLAEVTALIRREAVSIPEAAPVVAPPPAPSQVVVAAAAAPPPADSVRTASSTSAKPDTLQPAALIDGAAPAPAPAPAPAAARASAKVLTPPPGELAASAPPVRAEFPAFELGLGTDVVWRSYEFCPGSLQCGRQVFAGPAGLRFVTDRPYMGGTATLTAFPFGGLDERLASVGVEARYARRFIEVGMASPTGTVEYVQSYDEEFWGELLYRSAHELFGLTPWQGVRIGGGTRRFVTHSGAASTTSVRQLGATVGLEGGLPLVGKALQAELALTYAFGASPGTEERAANGGAIVGSDTVRARAGITGRFQGGFGYAVMADYSLFVDSFFGEGTRAEGGSAREEFVTLSAALRYAF